MRRISQEDKAGLYTTVIVHLSVLIALLCAGLNWARKEETSFVLDFSKLEEIERMQEEVEKLRKEAELQEAISRKIEQELGSAPVIRSVAVDRAALKDDRNTDADQLYKDAERLQKELDAGYELPDEDYAETAPLKKESTQQQKKQETYGGPSVVSYYLEGRKASRLPIPAYRCMGAGRVTVLISVDPSGTVTNAEIDESASSTDGCLRRFAVHAARLSKFSALSTAPPKQMGNIVYEFIAQ